MGTSFEGMGKMKGGRGMFNAFSGFGKGITGSVGAVRIGIALALLVSVALAMFMLSSPAKAVKSGGSGSSGETYNPIRIYVDDDGTIRVPFNKSVVFFNPYFGTTWGDLEVKCGGVTINKNYIIKYKINYNPEIGISLKPANELGQGVFVFVTGKRDCIVSILKSVNYEYSIKIKSKTPWIVTSVKGFSQLSDCRLDPSKGDIIYLIKTPISFEPVKSLDLSSLDNKVYLIMPNRDCSFALVPENSVVEFCQSLMNRGVCEEATYILPDDQARCMGEGGNVCIMPFTTRINNEDTMWGCCK